MHDAPTAARQCRPPAARSRRLLLAAAALAALLGFGAPPGLAQQDAGLPRRASVALEIAHRYARALPVRADTVVLAAQGTQEGHWRFVNRAGEMFTVGTPDEMQRVVTVLYPQARPGTRLALYMTEDTVFRHGVAFKSLPPNAEIHMVTGGESYRLLRRADPAGPQLYAEVRASLAVELRSLAQLEEALWQLARPLARARVRLLALEPGGPSSLLPSPRVEDGGKRALVDAIDPARLASAIGGVAGQTLVVLARMDRDQLYFRPAYGPEQGLALRPLIEAADAASVGLIVLLAASTPRQPGTHNLLWEASGREGAEAAPDGTLADLLNGVAGPSRRMAVAASLGRRRTELDVTLVGDLTGASAPRPADARFSGMASVMAAAGVYGVRASLLSAERQSELDQRILAGIPFAVQAGYAVLLVLGLIGAPAARTWWARVWPPEAPDEYAGRTGYWSARAVRGAAFMLVFLPLTAAVAAPLSLATQIWDGMRGPARWWRAIAGRSARAEPSAADIGTAQARTQRPAPPPAQPPPAPVPQPPPLMRMPAAQRPPPPVPPAQPAPVLATPAPVMPTPAPARPPERRPARSWIAALPEDDDTP